MIHTSMACLLCLTGFQDDAKPAPKSTTALTTVTVSGSIDREPQTCRIHVAEGNVQRPLLVFLHSWSSDVQQDNSRWTDLAIERGWHVLLPDFRGTNTRPEACGSRLARQDILDAVDWMVDHHAVDTRRIYLAGTSGGGHMSLLMAARHPDRFSAVSAWASISDLRAWWEFTSQDERFERYSRNIEAVAGGPPGTSAVDGQLRDRSSLPFLARAVNVPLDINAGHLDGTTGSVPWRHSVDAFNVLLQARGATPLDPRMIDFNKREPDEHYGRDILFRSTCGPARLTIFDGGHEDVAKAGIAFFESVDRPTSWSRSSTNFSTARSCCPRRCAPSLRWRIRLPHRCRWK
jgi:pimeloyl-ACP methyl ester carboxylesterase